MVQVRFAVEQLFAMKNASTNVIRCLPGSLKTFPTDAAVDSVNIVSMVFNKRNDHCLDDGYPLLQPSATDGAGCGVDIFTRWVSTWDLGVGTLSQY